MDEKVLAMTLLYVCMALWLSSRLVLTMRPVPTPHAVEFLEDVVWQTGDIILFHSNPFISLPTGVWSHVGLLVYHNGQPHIFEITDHDPVALKPLKPMLVDEMWKGDRAVAYRRIHPAPDVERLEQHVRAVLDRNIEYDHRYWRTLFRRLFGWTFPLPRGEPGESSTSICSELVAHALYECGILRTHPEDVFPDDFSRKLPLRAGYRWGPVVHLRLRT